MTIILKKELEADLSFLKLCQNNCVAKRYLADIMENRIYLPINTLQ